MRTFPTVLRKVILATLLVAATVLAATSGPVSEAAAGSNCTYYSNASHTTIVGQYGYDCCNNRVAWGTKTSFYQCSSACFICYPPPR